MRRSGKERRRKWRGDRVYQDRASFVGNYARGYEALGSTKRPLLRDVNIVTVVRGGCSEFTGQ